MVKSGMGNVTASGSYSLVRSPEIMKPVDASKQTLQSIEKDPAADYDLHSMDGWRFLRSVQRQGQAAQSNMSFELGSYRY